jgi:hypothetical protein
VINNREMIDPIVEKIEREVASWGGVSVSPHRYGGIEFRVGRRELGHLHGSRLADLPFPIAVERSLFRTAKLTLTHPSAGGWVSLIPVMAMSTVDRAFRPTTTARGFRASPPDNDAAG